MKYHGDVVDNLTILYENQSIIFLWKQNEDMQESFEESHKQQLEELRINLQKEHETRHSDVVSQHQMEMKSLREFIDTEHREKFEVKFVS